MQQPEQLRRSLIFYSSIRSEDKLLCLKFSRWNCGLSACDRIAGKPSNLISDQIHRRSLQSFAQKSLMRSKKHAGKKQKNGERDEITWDKTLISQVPGGTQDSHTPLVESAWLGLKSLDIEPVFHKGGCTNAERSGFERNSIDLSWTRVCTG